MTPDKLAPPAPLTLVSDSTGFGNCPAHTGEFCGAFDINTNSFYTWKNYGAPYQAAGFFRDAQGVVHLTGLVRAESITGDRRSCIGTAAIFVLPTGYRPAAAQIFTVLTTGDVVGRVDVYASGEVKCISGNSAVTADAYLSLSGISFRTP